ncbi:hypothetical protein NDU88_005110 [Pleurodeles waltl]|uniref:Uncharacterized protein n=1 Tax=Pleurodeles waltl TaxID=8319 RepID=A0AAV7PFZ3_PLEWA|nr:hypothetical protein NDU88_005110 [Pleurodeles waltl]
MFSPARRQRYPGAAEDEQTGQQCGHPDPVEPVPTLNSDYSRAKGAGPGSATLSEGDRSWRLTPRPRLRHHDVARSKPTKTKQAAEEQAKDLQEATQYPTNSFTVVREEQYMNFDTNVGSSCTLSVDLNKGTEVTPRTVDNL